MNSGLSCSFFSSSVCVCARASRMAAAAETVSPYLCLFTQVASQSHLAYTQTQSSAEQCDFCLHNQKTELSLVLRFANIFYSIFFPYPLLGLKIHTRNEYILHGTTETTCKDKLKLVQSKNILSLTPLNQMPLRSSAHWHAPHSIEVVVRSLAQSCFDHCRWKLGDCKSQKRKWNAAFVKWFELGTRLSTS